MKTIRFVPLAVLAPLLLATAAALTVWMVASVWATFTPEAEIILSDYNSSSNADVTSNFHSGGVSLDSVITFHPPDWGIATDADVPDGTVVGELTSQVTLGLLNGPCTNLLSVNFTLKDATADTSTEFADTGDIGNGTWNGYNPVCPGGQMRAICQWPGFLSELFPGVTPRARYFGWSEPLPGTKVILNFLVFEPGTSIPDHPSFPGDWGYGALTVLNNPTTAAAPSPLTDSCSPLESNNTIYGTADGLAVRTNPPYGGTYTFRSWSRGAHDNDGDGYANGIDNCPAAWNPDQRDSDGDDIGDACDVAPLGDPASPCGPGAGDDPQASDCDADGYMNRGDNCPFVVNPTQEDNDDDGLGNECDSAPDSAFGNTSRLEETVEIPVEISGPPRPAEGETATPTPTPTATAAATGTATATGTPTPEGTATPTAVAGEGCAPVIPGTYNGLVRLNGVPAAAGYEVTAVIDGTEWGSAIVSGGRYALDVPQKLPASEPCFAGGTITFKINGATCEPTEEWASGLHDVDLSCAPAATPTPPVVGPTTPPGTPPGTPPVTPVVTPAKPPVTGGGGLGGDQGLPLWAMIIAGWASLTVLAGLGTFATRIVKR